MTAVMTASSSAACSSSTSVLDWVGVPYDQHYAAVAEDVQPGEARVVGGIELCIVAQRPGSAPVLLTGVRPGFVRGELEITDFWVRSRPPTAPSTVALFEEGPDALEQATHGGGAQVRQTCLERDQEQARETAELLIEVTTYSARPAAVEGLVVEYTAGGAPRDLAVPVLVWLCPREAAPRRVGCAA